MSWLSLYFLSVRQPNFSTHMGRQAWSIRAIPTIHTVLLTPAMSTLPRKRELSTSPTALVPDEEVPKLDNPNASSKRRSNVPTANTPEVDAPLTSLPLSSQDQTYHSALSSTTPSLKNSHTSFRLRNTQHSLGSLPPNTILLHACNCAGKSGRGVAKAIARMYPKAEAVYARHCRRNSPEALVGHCLLIQPQSGERKDVWIACLFTSRGYGKRTARQQGRDRPEVILAQTRRALLDLRGQLDKYAASSSDLDVGERGELEASGETPLSARARKPEMQIYSPRFNNGLFAVPWHETEGTVVEVFAGWSGSWYILPDPSA